MGDDRCGTGSLAQCFALSVLLSTSACCPNAHQQAQPPPPPEPCPAVAAAEPPPPPPPKCESLDESCRSGTETRLAIGNNAATFRPPSGWTYAKEAEQSIAKAPDGKGWLAFTVTESEQPAVLLQSVEQLVARLSIEEVRTNFLKDRLKKPQHQLEADGGVVTKLWEVDKKSQFGTEPQLEGKEPGTLLLAVTPLSEQIVLVGAAFVTTPAGDSYAQTVMQSVQSLAPIDVGGDAEVSAPGAARTTTGPGPGQ